MLMMRTFAVGVNGRTVTGMTELKPCPFCGANEDELDFRYSYATKFTKPFAFVGCLRCGAMMVDTNEDHCLNDVKKAWNRRDGERHD